MAHNDARDLKMDIDKARLRSLYKTTPLIHAAHMAYNWLVILATAYLCQRHFHPLLYMLAVIIIGARMHALAILMHDATHYRFLKDKKWNDRITNLFSMYPLYTSIEKYRQNHLRHHLNLNTEDDPDWFAKLGKREFQFPKTKGEFLRTVLSYFLLYKGVGDAIWFLKRFNPVKKKETTWTDKLPILTFWVIVISSLTYFQLWPAYLLYWVLPYASTFFMFQYIRSVAEHFGELTYDHLLTSTRSVKTNWVESFIFAPHNVGFHIEHHLYPGVPYYHLPKLHDMLMEQPEYAGKAHITHGYIQGLFNDLGQVEQVELA